MCQKHAEGPPFKERNVHIEMLNFNLKLTITGFRVNLRNLWLCINSLDYLKDQEMLSRLTREPLMLTLTLSPKSVAEMK